LAKNSQSYDFTIGENGLINPMESDYFVTPNGLSLRPAGINNWDIIWTYKGKFRVVYIPAGVEIPEGLVLILERGDHYSLQTTVSISLQELNKKMTDFLKPFERLSREEFSERFPL